MRNSVLFRPEAQSINPKSEFGRGFCHEVPTEYNHFVAKASVRSLGAGPAFDLFFRAQEIARSRQDLLNHFRRRGIVHTPDRALAIH
jgi:hypothetical protein